MFPNRATPEWDDTLKTSHNLVLNIVMYGRNYQAVFKSNHVAPSRTMLNHLFLYQSLLAFGCVLPIMMFCYTHSLLLVEFSGGYFSLVLLNPDILISLELLAHCLLLHKQSCKYSKASEK